MLCQSQNALTWLFHRMVPPSHFLCSSDSPGRREGSWVFSFFFLGKSHFPEQLLTAEQVLAGCPGAGQQEWASPETFCFCDLPPCTRYPYPTWVSAQSYTPQTAPPILPGWAGVLRCCLPSLHITAPCQQPCQATLQDFTSGLFHKNLLSLIQGQERSQAAPSWRPGGLIMMI